jgi:FXSXX-COOH protein
MTPPTSPEIKTGLVRATELQLDELLARRDGGDPVLEHCLRRVVAQARSGDRARVAAFNAAPPRRS